MSWSGCSATYTAKSRTRKDSSEVYRAARNRPLTPPEKEANRLVSRERAANEHGFADLKTGAS
jgi:hypothetical protein